MFIPHELDKLVDTINEFSVIVEGKKDKRALEKLGVKNIFAISGKPIDDFVNLLPRDRRYIVLTDFDEEGEIKNKKIRRFLLKYRFNINEGMRRRMRDFFGITKVEELIKISKFMEDGYYGEISSINCKIFNRSRFYCRWRGRKTRRDRSYIWPD